ncbi:hypothetical protein BDW02DRAFT_347443 [Decorospora gaudefroyi]|uniref:Uncharacterized protein n=1 Tax=Decorospora gaudefroyi TaxID=184978 RepID=A0A6A5KDJ6_9PLEO|nr:hypothetical protein BDW02DRAFT_347443 [Decorospora gaudefroyi]
MSCFIYTSLLPDHYVVTPFTSPASSYVTILVSLITLAGCIGPVFPSLTPLASSYLTVLVSTITYACYIRPVFPSSHISFCSPSPCPAQPFLSRITIIRSPPTSPSHRVTHIRVQAVIIPVLSTYRAWTTKQCWSTAGGCNAWLSVALVRTALRVIGTRFAWGEERGRGCRDGWGGLRC